MPNFRYSNGVAWHQSRSSRLSSERRQIRPTMIRETEYIVVERLTRPVHTTHPSPAKRRISFHKVPVFTVLLECWAFIRRARYGSEDIVYSCRSRSFFDSKRLILIQPPRSGVPRPRLTVGILTQSTKTCVAHMIPEIGHEEKFRSFGFPSSESCNSNGHGHSAGNHQILDSV